MANAPVRRQRASLDRRIAEIMKDFEQNNRGYTYEETLGQGTYGLALLITNIADKKQYVGKAIYYVYGNDRLRLALKEIDVLKNLQHDHIVKYKDYYDVQKDKYMFIIMEFCPGGDLKGVLDDRRKSQQGRFEEDIVWNWSLQMLSALDYMHSRKPKVLHRDLKPANIFLSEDFKTLKLGDFGLARSLATLEMANTVCGTLPYLSPELLKGYESSTTVDYNHKADVWAAGCCIYEMIELELAAEDVDAKKKTIKLKAMPTDYNEKLVSIIQQMLIFNPEERPDISTILKTKHVCDVRATIQRKMSKLTIDLSDGTDASLSNSHSLLRDVKSDCQHSDPQAALAKYGYSINESLELRSTDGGTYDHIKSKESYEQLCSASRSFLIQTLDNKYNIKRLDLPYGCSQDQRKSFVYVSHDIFSNDSKVLILIHGSGKVSAGEWSRKDGKNQVRFWSVSLESSIRPIDIQPMLLDKLMINESLHSGSQIPWIVEAQNKGYALIIANLNNMYNNMDSGFSDPVHTKVNREEHLENIWDVVNNHCPAKKAAVLAHSYGGSALLNMAVSHESILLQKTFSVVFADSTHESLAPKPAISTNLKKFFTNNSRNYKPHDSIPLGNPIRSSGSSLSPAYSAGKVEHERTSNTIILEALTFIERL